MVMILKITEVGSHYAVTELGAIPFLAESGVV